MSKSCQFLQTDLSEPILIDGELAYPAVYRYPLPGYYVTKSAKVYSLLRFKNRVHLMTPRNSKDKLHQKIDFTLPDNWDPTYSYSCRQKNSKKARITLYLHQLMMGTFRSIYDHPPKELEDSWFEVITPDMVGQRRIPPKVIDWVRDTVFIDHLDTNPKNNLLDNLEYKKPRDNSRAAIEFYDGNFHNAKKNVKKKRAKKEKLLPNLLEILS